MIKKPIISNNSYSHHTYIGILPIIINIGTQSHQTLSGIGSTKYIIDHNPCLDITCALSRPAILLCCTYKYTCIIYAIKFEV